MTINLNQLFSASAQETASQQTAITSDSSRKTLLQSNVTARTALFDFCLFVALFFSETKNAVHINSVYQLACLLNVEQKRNHNVVKHFTDNVLLAKNKYQSQVLSLENSVISIKSETLLEKFNAEMSNANSTTRQQIKAVFAELNAVIEANEQQTTEQKQQSDNKSQKRATK